MSSKPIYVFARWQASPGNLDTVINLTKEMIRKSVEEPGNILYKVHQSINDPNTILLYEQYVDEVALEQHRSSAHF